MPMGVCVCLSMVAGDQPNQMLQAFLTGMAAGGEADAGGERLGGDGVIADAVGVQLAHRSRDDCDPEAGLHHADGGDHLRALAAEAGAEAGPLAALGDGVVQPGPELAREQDEGILRQRLDGDGDTAGQRMVRGQGDQHLLLIDQVVSQCRAAAAGQAQDGGIQLLAHQIAHQVGHAVLDGVQADLRPGLTKVVDELQHARVQHGGAGKAEAQRAQLATSDAPGLLHGLLGLRQYPLGILIEAQPRLGQLHAAGQPVKQRRAHLLFEFADLLAERRLGHAQRLGGAGKALFVCHGHQVAQVTEFHIWYVSKLMGLDIGIKL